MIDALRQSGCENLLLEAADAAIISFVAALRLSSRLSRSYQSPYALTALAQSRVAIEVIVAGLATRAFQASQQASTMAV